MDIEANLGAVCSAFNREVRTFFRACLFFKRDSPPDNCDDWTNENVSFGARNYECLTVKSFCNYSIHPFQKTLLERTTNGNCRTEIELPKGTVVSIFGMQKR